MKSIRIIKCLMLASSLSYIIACSPIIITDKRFPEERRGDPRGGPPRALNVPPGHLPPPGHCRIWYSGRPPGHQPPPFKCSTGRINIPLGTHLLSRVSENTVEVEEYDEQKPGIIKNSYTYTIQK